MNAEIITIGDELLIGQVVDTNSAFLSSELNKMGISVNRIVSVSDKHNEIISALKESSERAELIICTGGLGPTSDDITKKALADYFGSNMTLNQEVLEDIRKLLETRGIAINDSNIRQAELPDNCEVIHNSAGSAQGMWFKKEGRDYISLPGVPYEMKAIFREELEKRFRERFSLPPVLHTTILTHGIPESVMADLINDWEKNLPFNLKLAYLPSPGILRLRLTGYPNNDADLKILMEIETGKLSAILGDAIFGYNDDKLEVIIGNILRNNKLTLSTAESCTGGLISSRITSIAGSSDYYMGGIVAYSNEVKSTRLNVSPYTLIMNGAVSQPVAEQMADGARKNLNTDFSVAITGIAGPGGGTDEKPVGTTWIAVASKKRIISKVHNFGNERAQNMERATVAALFMLLQEIKNCL